MKSFLKPLFIAIAIAAAPVYFAYSQSAPAASSSVPFIPLFVSPQGGAAIRAGTAGATSGSATGVGTVGTGISTTWFIDVARNRIVMCSDMGAAASAGTVGGSPGLACTTQALPS